MNFLFRFAVICLLALFAVRGAEACEHAQRSIAHVPQAMPMHSVEAGLMSDVNLCSHSLGHASCCAQGCGVHCGAPSAETAFAAAIAGDTRPTVFPVALRSGITHAPPLPPPIV
jgi:hypothetical protein